MTKKVLSIIAGYAIFVLSSLALFRISGVNPHSTATTLFIVFTTIYGVVFSFLSGLISQIISRTVNLKINFGLAFIIAGFATFSLFKSEGTHWTQLLAIFIFAPVSVLGGLFFIERYNKQNQKQ